MVAIEIYVHGIRCCHSNCSLMNGISPYLSTPNLGPSVWNGGDGKDEDFCWTFLILNSNWKILILELSKMLARHLELSGWMHAMFSMKACSFWGWTVHTFHWQIKPLLCTVNFQIKTRVFERVQRWVHWKYFLSYYRVDSSASTISTSCFIELAISLLTAFPIFFNYFPSNVL